MIRRPLYALVVVAFALGAGAGQGRAQTDEPESVSELYSLAEVSGEATGLNLSYGFEDFTLPTILQAAVPFAHTDLTADPNARGVASLAYPGPLVTGLRAVAAQACAPDDEQCKEGAGNVPSYPVMAEASFPSDTPTAEEGNGAMRVTTSGTHALSIADYSAPAAPPGLDAIYRAGAMVSSSRSSVEEGDVVARARSVASDVVILDGLITIDEIVTDLVARSDGKASATEGKTTVSGVKFLGLDAVLDGKGIRLKQAPSSGSPTDGLGALTGPLADGLAPVAEQLSALMEEVTGQVGTNLNEVLAEGGFAIRVLEPNEVVSGPQASRIANGVLVESRFVGSDQEVLVQLVNLVPPDQRGAIGGYVPNPVTMLVETHVTTMSIGAGSVAVNAQPPFEIPDFPIDAPDVGGEVATPSPEVSDGGFESGLPELDDGGAGGGVSTGGTSPISNILGDALPAAAVLMLIAASPMFASGATKLADNVLDEAVSGCPEGLDSPPPREG